MAAKKPRDRRRRATGSGGGKSSGYDRKDAYYRRAKEEGYRSRAAYKLIEVNDRQRLIPRGGRILDLGCWPGGWLQVATAAAGPSATVVGVDLQETDPVPGATIFCGDILEQDVRVKIRAATPGGRYDLVLSDLSPNLSGIRARDEARGAELNDMTLSVAAELLAPGGKLLMKTFMGTETEEMLRNARQIMAGVRMTALHASRKGSGEHYLIGRLKPKSREDLLE